ncbi:hypothetical protein, partial [Saccharothrix sp. ST-888]|uniref:hypothetical protein n=1 Tax=Saccharothrix sp. ST-888 TaxID=1427391 RepID=UPI001E3B1E3B
SRNGRFLQAAFQRALRALRSFVFPAYQMFSAPFPEFHSSDPLSFGLSAFQTLSDCSDRLSRFPAFRRLLPG